jgi:hypothetical protein
LCGSGHRAWVNPALRLLKASSASRLACFGTRIMASLVVYRCGHADKSHGPRRGLVFLNRELDEYVRGMESVSRDNPTRTATTEPTTPVRALEAQAMRSVRLENSQLATKGEDFQPPGRRVRKLEATEQKNATRRKFIAMASMISRMIVNLRFSNRTELTVRTGSILYICWTLRDSAHRENPRSSKHSWSDSAFAGNFSLGRSRQFRADEVLARYSLRPPQTPRKSRNTLHQSFNRDTDETQLSVWVVPVVGIDSSRPFQTHKSFIPRSDKTDKSGRNAEARYTASTRNATIPPCVSRDRLRRIDGRVD